MIHPIQAICWTLFHSLWQGLIAAVFAGFILMWTKRTRPAIRYNLLSALLVLLTLTFGATFLYELQYSSVAGGVSPPGFLEFRQLAHEGHNVVVRYSVKPSIGNVIDDFLARNSPLIVAIWLIVLSVRLCRMLFVLGYTQYITQSKTTQPPPYWKNRLILLCHQLQVAKTVTLLESAIVKLPVVYGQLKPFILVPVGLLSQLTPEQVEAILLHELAHIRRNDYLVNLMQNFIEILFFFNPALLWLSALIRDERENCCDDVAIDQLKNRRQYVESLIRFKERSLYNAPLSAVGFAGRKSSFLHRIRRIVENKNYTLSRFEKGSLVCSSLVAASLAFVVAVPGSPNPEIMSRPTKVAPPPHSFAISWLVRPMDTVAKKLRAGVRQATIKTDAMKVLSVSGTINDTVPLPSDYNSVLARMHAVMADLMREGVVPDSAAVESFALDKDILTVNNQPQSEALHQEFKLKYGIRAFGLYYGPEKVPGHGYFITEKPSLPPPPHGVGGPPPHGVGEPPGLVKPVWPFHNGETMESIVANVIDDLVAESIIKDKSGPIAFLLTNRKFIVNGQLQPESIHQKLKDKYCSPTRYTLGYPGMAEDPDFGLHYNSETGSLGLGIHHWASDRMP